MTLPILSKARAQFGLRLCRAASALAICAAVQGNAQADPRVDWETGPAKLERTASGVIEQQGVASWYGRHWRGRKTADGHRFDERLLTAASLSLPFAARARVTNLHNGRSVDVVVNDRGPYVDGRVMDLSERAAVQLGMTRTGTAPVSIRALLIPTRAS